MNRKLALVAVLLGLALGSSSVSAIRPPVQVWLCSCSYCAVVSPTTSCGLITGETTSCQMFTLLNC